MTHLANARPPKAKLASFEGVLGAIGVLLSANVAIALLGFASLALTAQALSPAGLGVLALIEAYGRAFDQVLRLEPTQALIRQATPYKSTPERPEFRRLVRFAVVMDTAGSLVAGAAALLGLALASRWFGFNGQQTELAALFCLTILIPAPMTSVGLLRIFSRFGLYARLRVAAAALRLVGVVALNLAGASFAAFVVLLCAVSVFERIAPAASCWPMLRARAGKGVLRESLGGVRSENPGLWSFILSANLNVLARNSTRQFDVLVLGGLIGAAEMGLYVVAKRVGMVAIQVARPMQFVAYPRICELVERGKLQRVARMVATVMACFILLSAAGIGLFLLIGPFLVDLFFGSEYHAALPLILLQAIGASLFMTGAILNSALQGIRREGQLLGITILASAVFFVPLPWLVGEHGAIAAPALFVAMNTVWLSGCGLIFIRAICRLMLSDQR